MRGFRSHNDEPITYVWLAGRGCHSPYRGGGRLYFWAQQGLVGNLCEDMLAVVAKARTDRFVIYLVHNGPVLQGRHLESQAKPVPVG
jgi:hypothetical protein